MDRYLFICIPNTLKCYVREYPYLYHTIKLILTWLKLKNFDSIGEEVNMLKNGISFK